MKKNIIAFFVFALVLGVASPSGIFAQTSSIQTQLDMIAQLTKQIQDLQNQIRALQQKTVELRIQQRDQVSELAKNLRQGSTGDDVKILQALLAADPEVYPEGLITGLYGPLTTKAVKKFQSKHGIEQAGVVGPKTLKKLNEFFKENRLAFQVGVVNSNSSTTPNNNNDDEDEDEDNDNEEDVKERQICAIIPPGHLIAKGWLKKNNKPIVPVCQNLPPGIEKKIDDDHPTSTPDTTAPVISAVIAGSITLTGATITWTTNENSDSEVYYSTSTSVDKSTAPEVQNTAQVTSHSIILSGLSPSTVYRYIVESKDAAGNESSAPESSFITAAPDTAAPVISSITSSNVSSTSAAISWMTNEIATSKVYYSTLNPIVLASSSIAEAAGLSASHYVGLSGLTPSSTYYFVVESRDASNNTTTSSQYSFTTNP